MSELQLWLRVHVAVTVVMFLVTIALVVYVLLFASATRASLCKFRANLESQNRAERTFLKAHPDGFPQLGVSGAAMQQSIDRRQKTITSLASLSCH